MLTQRAESVLQDYVFHTRFIHRFVDGITHEEGVLQLPFEHNCMNWLLGHIVTNRSHVLETVGVAHPWQEEVRELYHTEMPPVTPESNSIRFETLIAYLDESVRLLEAALENVSDETLDEMHTNYRGEKTRFAHLTGFHWHETFHVGQLEILKAFIVSKRQPSQPVIGKVVWQDLTVRDAESVREFYSKVVGWEHSPVDMGDYADFNMIPPVETAPVAGICHARGSNANLPPQWLIYVSVDDVNESILRCEQLGGKIIDGPRSMGGSQFCVIQDPAGAVLALIDHVI